MCGIGACLSLIKENVAPKIVKMLINLEYRGYDSAGIAVIDPLGKISVRKGVGRINNLAMSLKFNEMKGYIGIGHTRWATHGAVTNSNAHPHVDCHNNISVVHNGIIENYIEIKERLIKFGHEFKTQTDTEVIPHLIEEKYRKAMSILDSLREALIELKGAYALVLITTHEPNKIFFARFFSPLVIGLGRNNIYIASDIPAFLEWTRRVIVLHDGDYGFISQNEIYIRNLFDPSVKSREIVTIEWTKEMAEKGGYKHYMLKEIHEQPESVKRTIIMASKQIDDTINLINKADYIYIVAAGTSYYASLHGQYAFAKYGIRSRAVIASEFIEEVGPILNRDDIVIGISQSGETADTLRALRFAKERGLKILAVTNVVGSAITRLADKSIIMGAGPEIGVAATKTFASQVATLDYLVLNLAKSHGFDVNSLLDKIANVHKDIEWVLEKNERKAMELSEILKGKNNAYYLGRGLGLSIALEGALKMKEIAYIHAEAYPAGESKHGPIALVTDDFPIFSVVLRDETYHRMHIAIEEMSSRGGYIIVITEKNDYDTIKLGDFNFLIPEGYSNILAPLVFIVPLQLVAYYTSIARGLDPDRPRNLAKSVTVE